MKQKSIETFANASEARDFAIEWQNWQSTQSMSLDQVIEWQGYFEKLAKLAEHAKHEPRPSH